MFLYYSRPIKYNSPIMNRVRFAPSPTGYVHVGNARTAIFNYLYAGKTGGTYILRIEDTDLARSKKEYEKTLIKDLKWLGIEWDEDPVKGGKYAPYRQSERFDLYKKYYDKLIAERKAYYCFCSEDELSAEKEAAKKEGKNLVYSGKCRNLNIEESIKRVVSGEKAVIRFKSQKGKDIVFDDMVRGTVSFNSELIGDMIIVRSNGIPAYNFTVVIDDNDMDISLVIRGEDHLTNTFKQLELFEALNFKKPEYAHLAMVMGEDNTKLSKRHGSVSISDFKEKGYLPEALFNYLSLLGWSPGNDREIFSKSELINIFDISKVSRSAAIFDFTKLNWFNREHIRILDPNKLGKRLSPFIKQREIAFDENEKTLRWIGETGLILSDYGHTLNELSYLFTEFFRFTPDKEVKERIVSSESSKKVISILYKNLEKMRSPVSFDSISSITKKIQTEFGIKGKELYHPIRLALTGKDTGIELKDFIPIIEKGSVLDFNPPVMNITGRLVHFIK